MVLVEILNVVVKHSPVATDRTPAVLDAIAHLATSLIAQAGQENKLDQHQIQVREQTARRERMQ